MKATEVIRESQNLSNKIEKTENIPFKEGSMELQNEVKTRKELVCKLNTILDTLNDTLGTLLT